MVTAPGGLGGKMDHSGRILPESTTDLQQAGGSSIEMTPEEYLRITPSRGCRQKSLLQTITARSWQMAKYDAVLLA